MIKNNSDHHHNDNVYIGGEDNTYGHPEWLWFDLICWLWLMTMMKMIIDDDYWWWWLMMMIDDDDDDDDWWWLMMIDDDMMIMIGNGEET